jgi:hypothetical protein
MTKNRSLTALFVVAVAVVLLTGGLMASNMGFKLNRSLVAAGGGAPPSNSGTQLLALPYNRQVGIDNASELFGDIGDVQNMARYDTLTDSYQVYTFGSTDFALEEGVGLQVKMGANVNYIVVGSHNPSAVVQLEGAGTASNSGTNLYAPPYHSTASTASELFVELGSGNTQNIAKYATDTDSYVVYTFGLTDFDLAPGEAYQIKMGQTVALSPSHY